MLQVVALASLDRFSLVALAKREVCFLPSFPYVQVDRLLICPTFEEIEINVLIK